MGEDARCDLPHRMGMVQKWNPAGACASVIYRYHSGGRTETPTGRTVVYARVSSHDQKSHLDGQVARCVAFANGRGLAVSETITEIGSGMNGYRKKLLRLLGDNTVEQLVVEHRDRLMRFGAE